MSAQPSRPSIFPAGGRPAAPPAVSRETHDAARKSVRALLDKSQAFHEMKPQDREALAKGLVQIGSYLAEPDGKRLRPEQMSAQVRADSFGGRRRVRLRRRGARRPRTPGTALQVSGRKGRRRECRRVARIR